MSAGGALAHECMIISRSGQGQQAVGNSPKWLSENMASHGAYRFTFDLLGATATEAELDQAVEMHLERGLQQWVAFFQGHTLLTNPHTGGDNPAGEKHSADLKGVEHWSDTELGQGMFAIAAEILAARS